MPCTTSARVPFKRVTRNRGFFGVLESPAPRLQSVWSLKPENRGGGVEIRGGGSKFTKNHQKSRFPAPRPAKFHEFPRFRQIGGLSQLPHPAEALFPKFHPTSFMFRPHMAFPILPRVIIIHQVPSIQISMDTINELYTLHLSRKPPLSLKIPIGETERMLYRNEVKRHNSARST